MKQEKPQVGRQNPEADWTNKLRDKLADREKPAPAGLWTDIEAHLQKKGVENRIEAEATKRPVRLLSLWTKRIAVAAAIIGVMTCNGFLMWEISHEQNAQMAEKITVNTPKRASETEIMHEKVYEIHPNAFITQKMLAQADIIHSNSPEKASEVLNLEVKTSISSEPPVEEPQMAMTSYQEQEPLNQFYENLAQTTKKSKRDRMSFNLYAQGGGGSQMSTNGVVMSPSMASSYNYYGHLLAPHGTRSDNEIIYLVDYKERQKHYQPVSFGLTTNIPVTSRLSFTTGLVYTRLHSDFTSIIGGFPLLKEQTLYYLGVPLSVQYQLWNYKRLSVYASAGGQADYNLKAHMEQQGVDYPAYRDRWQFSVHGAAGVEYDVIPQLGIYAEPGVKYYFNNGSNVSTFFKDKPTSFNLQLGLRLNLKK